MIRKRLTRQESQQQTRRKLLDAAAKVFAERGFHATSVDQIASAAGFTKGAVYANFESKDELFLALLDERTEAQVAAWAAPEGGQIDLAALARAQDEGLSRASERERRWSLLTLEFYLYAMREKRVRERLAERYRTLRAQVTALLEAHYRARRITPPIAPETLAWAMLGLSSGLSIQADLDPQAVPPTLLQDTLGWLVDKRPARPSTAD